MTKLRLVAALGAVVALSLYGCKKEQPASGGDTAAGSDVEGATAKNDGSGSAKNDGSGSAKNAQQPEAKAPEGCNSNFEQEIKTDYTLTQKCSPYTVPDGTTIAVDGWYLTIEPGVEVRFGESATLQVGYNSKGRLVAKGTPEAPIKFTSAKRHEAGYWGGIDVRSNGAGSTIEHAIIEYAGEPDGQALRMEGADGVVKNVKFVAVAGRAMDAEEGLKEFSGNDLKESGITGVAVEVRTPSLSAFKPDNQFPEDTVIAFTGNVEKSVTMRPAGAPYRLTDSINFDGKDGQTATLTIEAGTTIQMPTDGRLDLGYNNAAAFIVKGTAEQPVIFTSADENPQKGAWQGVRLRASTKAISIDYAKFEWGGGSDGAALTFESKALGKLSHSTFAHSAGAGILASEPAQPFEAFSGNTFEDLDGPALSLNIANANKLPADNTFPKDSFIRLTGGQLNRDTVLTAQSVPYRIEDSVSIESEDANKIATLTFEPGANVQLSPGVQLTFGYNNPGRLVAKGAPDKQIHFAAATEPWNGIRLSDSGKIEVAHAVFENVGDGHPGIDSTEKAQGTVQDVVFKKMDVGMKVCPNIKASGLKGESVPKVEDKDC